MSAGNAAALDRARGLVRAAHTLGPSTSLLRIEEQLRSGDANARQLAKLIESSPALAALIADSASQQADVATEARSAADAALALVGVPRENWEGLWAGLLPGVRTGISELMTVFDLTEG
jgi:hypothetical protein